MNRNGQLAILMLFLVAIVLVITTLVSFYSFENSFSSKSVFVSKILSGISFGNEYFVNRAILIADETIRSNSADLKGKFREVAISKNLMVQSPAGNFFKKIGDGGFYFAKETDDLYKLKIEGLFIQASSGNNIGRRDFDMCLLFGKNGNYLKEIANSEVYKVHCNKK